LAPTVGIAATGFCYSGGILQKDHQILRLPAAVARLLQQIHPLQIDFIINKQTIFIEPKNCSSHQCRVQHQQRVPSKKKEFRQN
jgi:hypothetical protein